MFRRPAQAPETTHSVVHAGTFALPAARGDFGDGAVQLMQAADVFVALVEYDRASTRTALFSVAGFPPPLGAEDFSRSSLQVARAAQAGVQRWFTEAGRAWCLYVVIGSWDDGAALAARANRLVSSIEVSPLP